MSQATLARKATTPRVPQITPIWNQGRNLKAKPPGLDAEQLHGSVLATGKARNGETRLKSNGAAATN